MENIRIEKGFNNLSLVASRDQWNARKVTYGEKLETFLLLTMTRSNVASKKINTNSGPDLGLVRPTVLVTVILRPQPGTSFQLF